MSKRKFKTGDNILVIKGIHKGMRGNISSAFEYKGRVRYLVLFKSFKALMYSYQMNLDVERTILEKAKEENRPALSKICRKVVEEAFKEDESTAIKRMVESIGNQEESKLKPGAHVMLSKQGLAKIYISGTISSGHSYEWVRDHNYHTIDRVDAFEGINFYTLIGFVNTYHFTKEDLLPVGYGIGEKVRFTRETLVKLGVELSKYYGDDTISKLPHVITDSRKILCVYHKDDNVLYQLDGFCFGKFFYEHEIEPAND